MSETYLVPGDTLQRIDPGEWGAHSFSPLETHTLEYLDLDLLLWARPERHFFEVYTATTLGHPTGTPISTGAGVDTYKWRLMALKRRRFKMTPVLLETGLIYAVVIRVDPSDPVFSIFWQYQAATGNYPRGHRMWSGNNGVTWADYPADDHIFGEFGNPPLPKPEPPPPMENFALTDITFYHTPDAITLTIPTNVPCHLTCYYTDVKPLKHHTSAIVRGLSVPWDTYFCFVAWKSVEQEEEGDTLYHTFLFDTWPACSKFTDQWDLSEGTQPPFWEPWGDTLTENHPWEQSFPPDQAEYSLSDGTLRLFNPDAPKAGLQAVVGHGVFLLQAPDGAPLCFNAHSPAYIIDQPTDWLAYHFMMTKELYSLLLELKIDHGNHWVRVYGYDTVQNTTAFYGYYDNPGPINLLEFWKWARRFLGQSDDPTGWDCLAVYITLERDAPPTLLELTSDYFNLFYPTRKPAAGYGNERYFTFRGNIEQSLSPSVGPIFSHCHPGADPPLIEEQTQGVWLVHFAGGVFWDRIGQALTIPGRDVSGLSFYIRKVGNPPGIITFTIRRTSDDSILASKLYGNANTVPAIPTWIEVTFDDLIPINEYVRILMEWTGPPGDVGNYLEFWGTLTNVKPAEMVTRWYDLHGYWTNTPAWDAKYRYSYYPSS